MKTLKETFHVLWLVPILIGCASMTEPKEPTLYERLGGVYNIATVVDDFIERANANSRLNANPAINEARQRVPIAGLKFQVTSQMCEAAGGPQKYLGRSMNESHKHLNITDREWQLLLDDFKASLVKFDVPEKEQEELFAIIESTKADIVVKGK